MCFAPLEKKKKKFEETVGIINLVCSLLAQRQTF